MPRIEVMSVRGDDLLAEWGRDTGTEDLKSISQRFKGLRAKGYSAFTVHSGRRLDAFDPEIEENVIFIAPLVGG